MALRLPLLQELLLALTLPGREEEASLYPSDLWRRWGPMESDRPVSIYVHVPFCRAKCPYCAFYSETYSPETADLYIKALARDLLWWSELCPGARIETIYLGGGTPSLLGPRGLNRIISLIQEYFPLYNDREPGSVEVTVEVNPGTVSGPEFFSRTRANRFSIGLQSLSPRGLKCLGRTHSPEQALDCLNWASQAGAQVSADLIFNWPGQTLLDWMEDLEGLLARAPGHISLYDLHPGEGTPMEKGWEGDPDREHAMYWWACRRLEQAGYGGYEISNFALPGRESKHNLGIWEGRDFLGLGPGAHSRVAGLRWMVPGSLTEYLAWARRTDGSGRALDGRWRPLMEPFFEGLNDILAGYAIMALRSDRGLSQDFLIKSFNAGWQELFSGPVDELAGTGLLTADSRGLRLSPRGRMFGNRVFEAFL